MSDWLELTDDELEALRPLTIDARELSSADCRRLRVAFEDMLTRALTIFQEETGRSPDAEELLIIAESCVAWINEDLAARLRQEAVGLH